MYTDIEILEDRNPDHNGACALHRALKTAPTPTARRKMADSLAMLKEKEGITWERKLLKVKNLRSAAEIGLVRTDRQTDYDNSRVHAR